MYYFSERIVMAIPSDNLDLIAIGVLRWAHFPVIYEPLGAKIVNYGNKRRWGVDRRLKFRKLIQEPRSWQHSDLANTRRSPDVVSMLAQWASIETTLGERLVFSGDALWVSRPGVDHGQTCQLWPLTYPRIYRKSQEHLICAGDSRLVSYWPYREVLIWPNTNNALSPVMTRVSQGGNLK